MKLAPSILSLVAALSCFAVAAPPDTQPALPHSNYPIVYTTPTVEHITQTLQRLRQRIEDASALRVVAPNAELERGAEGLFAPISYPTAVVYAGMLNAAEATGDKAFAQYDATRFQFFADNLTKMQTAGITEVDKTRGPFHHLLAPTSLDACGALGAAFIKARRQNVGPDLKPIIDGFADYVSHGQKRLADGTLARSRPGKNSVWADDMYMSIPLLAQMGALTGQASYFDDAANQVNLFGSHLFVQSQLLFTHGTNTDNPANQPKYFWGRANGWCMMAMVELLDVLPENHPQRPNILRLLRAHAEGIANCQSGVGLWHQMLDRPETYLESSASAMFTFALARSINRGWLDAAAFGPVAQAGWNGLAGRISDDGRISGTCVATTYAADYVYYYNRAAADDTLSYGPALMAGAEMINLLTNPHITIRNDGRGACFYQPHD